MTHNRHIPAYAKGAPEGCGFYLEECTKSNWSTRQLERQINSFFYQRLLSSQDKDSVRNEIQTLEKGVEAKDIIRDPVLERAGHETSGMSDVFKELLRTPLHLKVFLTWQRRVQFFIHCMLYWRNYGNSGF